MGAVASVLRTATAVVQSERYLLTDDEVEEDRENERAQRRAITYCIETIYYGAAVEITAIATPGHHMKSALITLEENDGSYPDTCLVDPEGNVLVTTATRRKKKRKHHAISAKALAGLRDPPKPPGPPVASRISDFDMEVSWEPPADLGGELVGKYEVQYRAADARWQPLAANNVLRGDERIKTVAPLEPNTAYAFRVRAKNVFGWSPWSEEAFARTKPAPPAPPSPPFAATVLPEAIALFWRPPALANGSPVRLYKLRARVARHNSSSSSSSSRSSSEWTTIYSGPMRRHLACGLDPGTTYAFCLAAANAVGVSGWSEAVSFRTPTGRGKNDGYAPPENAALLRGGDLWLECWDPQSESVFYFNRASAERRADPPPAWLDAKREEEGVSRETILSLVTDEAARFRLKRFQFLRNLKRNSAPPPIDGKLPLTVRRSRLARDSIAALRAVPAPDLGAARLRVEFEGEPGIDSGGLTKDWYLWCSRAFCAAGYFRPTPAGDLELAETPRDASIDDYRVVGRFLAKALYDQHCVDLPFAPAVYSTLRGVVGSTAFSAAVLDDDDDDVSIEILEAVLDEVKGIDPDFHRSLVWVRNNDPKDLAATFAVDGGDQGEIDLIPGGRRRDVTETNKHQYVYLVARWRSRHRVAIEIDALLSGCADLGVHPETLRSFTNDELDRLVNGRRDLDVDEMRAFSIHQGGENDDFFPVDHVSAMWFWQFMHEADAKIRELVLVFATGSNRVPIDGFDPPFTLCLDAAKIPDALPVAHTCFNQLVLPLYTDYATMRKQLHLAITTATTFELA